VTEPDLHSPQEVKAYAMALRSLLRYLGVNSGDMQKGVMRIEPNISVRRKGSQILGTRSEIKNLNSFRALERAVAFEIERQSNLLERGELVRQETRGWDESRGVTFTQRVKEGEEDYRYFPEPDLPPLVIEQDWLEQISTSLPELPRAKLNRFQSDYHLSIYDANVLIAEPAVADYFEQVIQESPHASPKIVANWISGDLFNLMNQSGEAIDAIRITPQGLGRLLELVVQGEINQTTGKAVLSQMYSSGKTADEIVTVSGFRQISDEHEMTRLVKHVLDENPEQVEAYMAGKETIGRWLFGQVMRAAKGQANPQVLQKELDAQLLQRKEKGD
jgi:aspartyl-tRNA(Asn)/glutamyl-tRNA(Gln) amidotransferase subunit B